jgi:alpha-tubulin suppressor-like RCC1 family protein
VFGLTQLQCIWAHTATLLSIISAPSEASSQRMPLFSAGVAVVAIATGARADSGTYHTCAIVNGGSLLCVGGNYVGQLGIGSTTDQSKPVAVTIGAGGLHTSNCHQV